MRSKRAAILLVSGICVLSAGVGLAQGFERGRQPIPIFPEREAPARPQERRMNPNATEALTLAMEAQRHALAIGTAAANDPDLAVAIDHAERAVGLARRALVLDNSVAPAYAALGLARRQTWHWADALEAFEHAYTLAPEDANIAFNYAWTSAFAGDHDRAIEIAQNAVDRDPGSANAYRDLGIVFAYAGDTRRASAALRQCTGANPALGVCHIYLGFMQFRLGNLPGAEAALREAERLFGSGMSPAAASSLAHAYARAGLSEDARRLVDRLTGMQQERVVGVGSWPLAYLAIGDEEGAYAWLQRAAAKADNHEPDEGFFNLMIIKHNVQANPVLEQPRFAALRERIGATGETQ